MDSLSEGVIAKRAQLAEIQKQNAERAARIAKLQAAEKKEFTMAEIDEILTNAPSLPSPPKVEKPWIPPAPEQIPPEPTEEEIKQRVGVGQRAIVKAGAGTLQVTVVSKPDVYGFVKCVVHGGLGQSQSLDIPVKDFL